MIIKFMTLKGKNVVVTGGAGFIGSWIAEYASKDNNVTVFDDMSSGTKANIDLVKSSIRLVKGDVRSQADVDSALKGADVVFHQAANVKIQVSIKDPALDASINVGGTINVLEACRKHDIANVVFAASSAVYGHPERIPTKESDRKAPLSPYAVSKMTGESYMDLYSNLHGIKTACLRYFNVYGPRQSADSPYSGVVSLFVRNAVGGKPMTIFGDGEQSRDFVNVRDVAKANMLAAECKKATGPINIGTGERITLNGLVRLLEKIKGRKFKVIYKKAREGDARHSCADISLARNVLGFKPSVNIEDGLRELITP